MPKQVNFIFEKKVRLINSVESKTDPFGYFCAQTELQNVNEIESFSYRWPIVLYIVEYRKIK